MLLIVGHGPSVGRAPDDFVDRHIVCRLRRAETLVGTKTHIICSSQLRYKQAGSEFWYIHGKFARLCRDKLKEFKPQFPKPSTGLCAAILAKYHGYSKIGVIGFDFTLHPELTDGDNWRHDAYAENRCINSLGVIDLEQVF